MFYHRAISSNFMKLLKLSKNTLQTDSKSNETLFAILYYIFLLK